MPSIPAQQNTSRQADPSAQAIIRELLDCWPASSLPPGPLCVRAANYVNASAPDHGDGLPDRVEIARIIDPAAWEFADRWRSNPIMGGEVAYEARASLTKADAILALCRGKQQVERPESPCADAGSDFPRSPQAQHSDGGGET